MKLKIPCFCDNVFDVEVPEEIDLDSSPSYFEEIQNGTFANFTCPSCHKKHKPEYRLSILWPSKNLHFEVFPELDRGEFYRRKKAPPPKKPYTLETIIGFPEMADRLAIIKDGFEPAPVEAIKYFLQLKAEEQYPDDEIEVWYYGTNASGADQSQGAKNLDKQEPGGQSTPEQVWLEFHLHGLRQDEVAVTRVPYSLYQKTLDDYKKHPKNEIFTALRVRSYLSVKNTMRAEELK